MTGFFHPFTDKEAHSAETMMRDLQKADWAKPLVRLISDKAASRASIWPYSSSFVLGMRSVPRASCRPTKSPVKAVQQSTLGSNRRVCFPRRTYAPDRYGGRWAATHETFNFDGTLWTEKFESLSTGINDGKDSEEGETLKARPTHLPEVRAGWKTSQVSAPEWRNKHPAGRLSHLPRWRRPS